MELKRYRRALLFANCILLIVPYGIETVYGKPRLIRVVLLLIVPYGIETSVSDFLHSINFSFNRTLWN